MKKLFADEEELTASQTVGEELVFSDEIPESFSVGLTLNDTYTSTVTADENVLVKNGTVIRSGFPAGIQLTSELKSLKEVCGEKILKVIIETCLLTNEEKIKMCEIVTASGADFIKTSTGFSTAGATKEDVALFAAHVGKNVQIKAAGGISSLADAEDFINLGATRLGTSRIVKIAKNEKSTSTY